MRDKKSMKKISKKQKGFTLPEIIVSVAIFGLIMLGVTAFEKDVFTYNTTLSNTILGQQEAKQALKTMEKEIRMATVSNTGAYAIAEATSSALTIYTDVDSDGLEDQVRYYLSSTTLKKVVIKPTGSPLGYTTTTTVSELVHNIVSSSTVPIFQYYSGSYAGTTSPLSSPVNVASVRLIKITFIIDADNKKSPLPMTVTTQISIRSLKDNQ